MLFGEEKIVNAKRKRLQLPKWSECRLLWKLPITLNCPTFCELPPCSAGLVLGWFQDYLGVASD